MDWGITLGSTYFNSLDIIVFSLSLIGGISGAFEGFAKSFTSKAGLIVGLIVGIMFTKPVSEVILDRFSMNPLLAALVSFVVTFLVGYWVLIWLGSVLSNLLSKLGIGVVDALLGFVFGLILTFFVCGGILYVFSFQHFVDLSSIVGDSYLYNNYIVSLIPMVAEKVTS